MCDQHAEIFISNGKQLIFQIPAVQAVESEVILNKGEYKITKDCIFSENLKVENLDRVQIFRSI